jgi:hypothetical protein
MNNCLADYYRSPERYTRFAAKVPTLGASGYFRFGGSAICFGNYSGCQPTTDPAETLHDALSDTIVEGGNVSLPFDLGEVVTNLRCERYMPDWRNGNSRSALARAYYFLRPLLSVSVRRHLQRVHLRGWDSLSFPQWPVDCSVDDLLAQLLLLVLRSSKMEHIPFIWFWPDGAPSAAIMTHDVEEELGRDFCSTLMDIDDSFEIKSSFQLVPEQRYHVSREFLSSICNRGFEVAVHDLNHDGHLYRDREQFRERAAKINLYGKAFGAKGFRAGVLYRKQLWFDDLDFSYDMSVPNVAHLDPQRGGCCTVMPFFLGSILEIPVTTTQDYSLFHILNDYSIDVWKRQTELIMQRHGLLSFIVHPDYIIGSRERTIYEALLGFLDCLREEKGIWIATPGEVNHWWRQRAEMKLVEDSAGWRIEGPGKDRARIAYATEKDGQLVFTLGANAAAKSASVPT